MTVELSYAGRTLRILPPRESMRIERYMSTSDLHEWDQRDFQNGIGHLPLPEVYYPNFRLGSLWWPTGASKFAVGRYVINQSDLDVIGPLALPAAGPTPQNLILSYNGQNITTEMFLLPPRPMFQTQSGTQPTYFVTLVDKRFYWWYKSGKITGSDLASWTSLLSSILLQMGESSATIDPISEDYGEPGDRWISKYQFLPMLLDAACFACGLRCVRKMDGTVVLQNICNAKNINATEILKAYPDDQFSGSGSGTPTYIPVLGGLYNQNYVARSVPASVTVVQEDDISSAIALTSLGLTPYSGITGFDGTKVIFGDPNGSGTGSGGGSGTDCCSTATIGYNRRVAKDWYCWQLSSPDVLFRELVNWDINGLNEYVEIRWTPDRVTTEVRRPTLNSRSLGAFPFSGSGGSGNSGSGSGSGCECFNLDQAIGDILGRLCVTRSGSGPLTAITNMFFRNGSGICTQVPDCGSGSGACGSPTSTTICDCGGSPTTISTVLACRFTWIAGTTPTSGIDGKTFYAFADPDFAPCLWRCNTTVDISDIGGSSTTPFGFELSLSDSGGTPEMIISGDTSGCSAGVTNIRWNPSCTAGPCTPTACCTDLITCNPFTADFAGFPTAGAALFNGACNNGSAVILSSSYRVEVSEVV